MKILDRIRAKGGDVRLDAGRLVITRGRLSVEAVEWLRAHRSDVIAELVGSWHREDWEERAAIREFDGGQDRHDAELQAAIEIMRGRQC